MPRGQGDGVVPRGGGAQKKKKEILKAKRADGRNKVAAATEKFNRDWASWTGEGAPSSADGVDTVAATTTPLGPRGATDLKSVFQKQAKDSIARLRLQSQRPFVRQQEGQRPVSHFSHDVVPMP